MATQNHIINWEEQLELHREWLIRLARARVEDSHAAEDIVQDASLAVIRQNPQLEDPSKIRSWLYRVVIRRTADHLRQRYRRERLAEGYSQEDSWGEDENWDWLLKAEQQKQLCAALDHLSDEDREIVVLKFVKNWSYKHLADKFGRTERAIEYRLVRAKQQLRAELLRMNGNVDD